ncbi:MAG: UDP-N-acetylglucosamine 1-carboxyvinyltransferase [Deltaproteobacteria bacterium]|nr:UDP-N-acetylglucosamine 1-carboxyvinyltransferase [Deltaproteobacteria bacterium]MBW2676378.1 UDP-N-acetylglucosamine 1-carboxyvinyltransferase [Deltaproteobacteria bacterium]
MDKIIVTGGKRLEGEIKVSGAKNAALPILISSLLADGWNTYRNVPRLMDIESTKVLLSNLGAEIETDGDTVRINAQGFHNHEAPYDLVRKMRASILVLGPILARLKKARVSLPGGCAIGARPINLHLKGLARLGAAIDLKHGYVEAKAPRLKGNEIYFDVTTVTGTENLLMAAVLAEGTTVLRNVAREPEVKALADVLVQMGADISGAGTSMMVIKGVPELKPVSVSILPDRIETGTLMVAAALTRGEVVLTGCEPGHLEAVIHKLRLTGAEVITAGSRIKVSGPAEISSVDVKTLAYPGFPTDMQAQFMVLMSMAKGLSIISETIFENRFIHVSELKRMGADINISGDTALIKGVPRLGGAPVMATDLRASASLVLAGLAAKGTTEVRRVYHLDRGYESLDKKLALLGADIHREKE